MEPQNNQNVNSFIHNDLPPDKLASALAFATNIHKNIAGFGNQPAGTTDQSLVSPQPPQTQQNAPQQQEMPQQQQPAPAPTTPPTRDFKTELEAFKKEVKDEIKTELSSIRKSVEDALNQEDDKQEETKTAKNTD